MNPNQFMHQNQIFGWSRKVFQDHKYVVDGFGRPSDTI